MIDRPTLYLVKRKEKVKKGGRGSVWEKGKRKG
jgi:hypothetical protein